MANEAHMSILSGKNDGNHVITYKLSEQLESACVALMQSAVSATQQVQPESKQLTEWEIKQIVEKCVKEHLKRLAGYGDDTADALTKLNETYDPRIVEARKKAALLTAKAEALRARKKFQAVLDGDEVDDDDYHRRY